MDCAAPEAARLCFWCLQCQIKVRDIKEERLETRLAKSKGCYPVFNHALSVFVAKQGRRRSTQGKMGGTFFGNAEQEHPSFMKCTDSRSSGRQRCACDVWIWWAVLEPSRSQTDRDLSHFMKSFCFTRSCVASLHLASQLVSFRLKHTLVQTFHHPSGLFLVSEPTTFPFRWCFLIGFLKI